MIIRYTHSWHGDEKFRRLEVLLAILLVLPFTAGGCGVGLEVVDALEPEDAGSGLEWLLMVFPLIGLVAGLVSGRIVLHYLVHKPIDAISSYQYISRVLKAKTTLAEASRLSALFMGDSAGKWHPLRETEYMDSVDKIHYLRASFKIICSGGDFSDLNTEEQRAWHKGIQLRRDLYG